MPELPEVEVVRAGLEPALVGARIDSVQVVDPRSLKRHDARRGDFVGMLQGATVLSAERRGKFMWFPLDSGDALVTHLGMSGQVLLRDPAAEPDRHLRIQYGITHPEHGKLLVNFVDQRIFGSMAVDELVEQPSGLVPAQAAHIALDPLDSFFDDELFISRLRKKSTGVKRALLDQTLISGVGNIYADESLWAAKIHGERNADALSKAKAQELLLEVRKVLNKALAEGGTSFDAQYVNVNGQSGYFAHSLNAYGQQGKPCPRCGTPIKKVSFMNRGSHFCPRCQKK
ncbi:bifunctional DNA-formamidopyrimidine glycosylase/DNA-(apurinic or apyrimidinic site) lyase [Aurantimicrobium sp. MWH-Uga1]|uniref:bifunctional DNA-formamidopyrimidine glycosylase/DNA-(apurinic or apyrimidinic site) lyase n=1 Tax=Aurantimicrobium sp. MWH-Uga1 TaxID=2079575 RepID=UPI000DEE0ADC|nr:bifunctional DNA-formamidopyrimidine glycosylase/DNA-(apurinic or apyrimidinic site) lyase [Aurantimicrobium sp. MWH-Uga1]AXE54850.1 Formamidopyrimidine-DNA glycosylase 1 [Aurantimicrobium sp. MWH-Uga1]